MYFVIPPPALTILVTGVDAREGEGYLTRTDSIMLVNLDPPRRQVSLLSIPRDLFIDVPNYGYQRINTVNALGEQEAAGRGVTLLSESIENNFTLDIERYARLDFQGFVRLIDAVGGVTINVEREIVDSNFPAPGGGTQVIRFEPGEQTMDGATALIYARTRYSDDDYQRAGRQQQVISALSVKLINPVNWGTLITTFNQSVDTNMSVLDMALYAPVVLLNAGSFETLVIDRDLIAATVDGLATPNYNALAQWLDTHLR